MEMNLHNITWEYEENDWGRSLIGKRPVSYDERMLSLLSDVRMPITSESIKSFTVDQLLAVRHIASKNKYDGLYKLFRIEYESRLRFLESMKERLMK